jgi:hypothetical protein
MSRTPKDPVKTRLWITLVVSVILLVLVAVCIALLGGGRLALESPEYRVVETLGDVEIRAYEPYLVAETEVDGPLEEAGNRGFRTLARYIFGANQARRKVEMTAPVTQSKAASEKISMTAPVTQKRTGGRFTIQFMMPSEYTKETIPTPNDSAIRIREVPSRRLAAIRYSGTWSRKNYDQHLRELRDTLRQHGYQAVGEPIWARYDPPFKPWFLRRNEILTAFERSASAS